MKRFRKPGALAQMTLGLVTMTLSILMLADLLLGLTPDPNRHRQIIRQQLSESIAVQAAAHLQADDIPAIERMLSEVVRRITDISSAGLRKVNGNLIISIGPHDQSWTLKNSGKGASEPATKSTSDNIQVPLLADGQRWGAVEVAFASDSSSWWARTIRSPLTQQSVFVALVGALAFSLYMRRALQHLDPASVIPDRVSRAFDSMVEGVVVLDARGRIMLVNKKFMEFSDERPGKGGPTRIGQSLSGLPWLSETLPGDLAMHPWIRAMAERTNISEQFVIRSSKPNSDAEATDRPGSEQVEENWVVFSCVPIIDNSQVVRGCMVTFNDMTELHRMNLALKTAMQDVEAGREELRRNNLLLQHLATHDVLTECLNRRAFMERAPDLLKAAVRQGRPLGCMMLDIDHFKAINDTCGHSVGDQVIVEVARIMRESVPDDHLVCRYGGEEFCIASPSMSLAQTLFLAERIRSRVAEEVAGCIKSDSDIRANITISIGISMLISGADTLFTLIERADQALYTAKRGGRNRVEKLSAVGEKTNAGIVDVVPMKKSGEQDVNLI